MIAKSPAEQELNDSFFVSLPGCLFERPGCARVLSNHNHNSDVTHVMLIQPASGQWPRPPALLNGSISRCYCPEQLIFKKVPPFSSRLIQPLCHEIIKATQTVESTSPRILLQSSPTTLHVASKLSTFKPIPSTCTASLSPFFKTIRQLFMSRLLTILTSSPTSTNIYDIYCFIVHIKNKIATKEMSMRRQPSKRQRLFSNHRMLQQRHSPGHLNL